MKAIHIKSDRWNFETSDGVLITPLGGNSLNHRHPGQRTLFQNFDADCDGRLGIMADLGLNCVRQAIDINESVRPGHQ